MKRDLTGVER